MGIWALPRLALVRKTIALILGMSFLLPSILWAFEPATFKTGQQLFTFSRQTIEIPKTFATVLKTFRGNDQLIIHIQDLHCNYEVQSNIRNLIQHLAQAGQVPMVAVEGASLPVNTTPIRSFPLAASREDVADYFVRQGKLSGAEWYAALAEHPVFLEGVESPELYAEDKQAVDFLQRSEGQGYCQDLRELLDSVKPTVYNPGLLKFDQERNAYKQGSLGIPRYSQFLLQTARAQGVDTDAYSNLRQYAASQQALFFAEVDPDQLFQEIDQLDRRLREALYDQDSQRRLDELGRRLDLIEKMINISALPAELAEFRERPESFRIRSFLDFLNEHRGAPSPEPDAELATLDQYVETAARFYQVADQRSQAFVKNTLARMDQHRTRVTVLITGGFHTEKILQELQARNISYVSLKPRLTHQDLVNPYYSLLKNQSSPLEKLLSQNQRIFSLEPFLPKTVDPLVRPQESALTDRERKFSRTLELYLKASAALRACLLTRAGRALQAVVQPALAGVLGKPDPFVSIDSQRLHVYPDGTVSFPCRLGDGRELITVGWPAGKTLALEEKETVQQADFKSGTLAVLQPGREKAVLARLGQTKGETITGLVRLTVWYVGFVLALRLEQQIAAARRWLDQHPLTWRNPVLFMQDAATGQKIPAGLQWPVFLAMSSERPGQSGTLALQDESLQRQARLLNLMRSWDKEAVHRALIWIEQNAATLLPREAAIYTLFLVELHPLQFTSMANPYRRWRALDALRSRLDPASFLRQLADRALEVESVYGKKNVYTFDGRLNAQYAFLLAYPGIRDLLAAGGVINDVGIGGPVPSTVHLVRFLRSRGLHNRVIAADTVIPAYVLQSKRDPKLFAYYDQDRNVMARYKDSGMVMEASEETDAFPHHVPDFQNSALREKYEIQTEPYQKYAQDPEYGFELVNASYGAGVKADLKFCMNTLYMDAGQEIKNLESMAEDLSDNGFILEGMTNCFTVYQKQQGRLRPLSIHYIAKNECHTLSLERRFFSMKEAEDFQSIYTSLGDAGKTGYSVLLRRYGFQPSDFSSFSLNVAPAVPVQVARISPDLSEDTIPHEKRNAALEEMIRQARVYRMTPAGDVRLELHRDLITKQAAEDTEKREAIRETVGPRLERIRKEGGSLVQALQYISVTQLARKLQLSQSEVLDRLLEIALRVDVLVVRDRLTLHPDGPIAHARAGVTRAGDTGIWLGEKLFTAPDVTDVDIAQLMLEEAQHILAPHVDHDVAQHDDKLAHKLMKAASALGETPGTEACERDMAAASSAAPVYTLVSSEEKAGVLARLQANLKTWYRAYDAKRFQELRNRLAFRDRVAEVPLEGFRQDNARVTLVKEIQDNKPVYWFMKSHVLSNPDLNVVRRERLAYLLTRGVANFAEIRDLSRAEADRLQSSKGVYTYYLSRLILPENIDIKKLPDQTPAEAFTSILVASIWMRKWDYHLDNFGLVGEIPVAIDHDMAFSADYYSADDVGTARFAVSLLNFLLFRALVSNKIYDPEVQRELDLVDILQDNNPMARLAAMRRLIAKYDLEKGLLEAQGLTPELIRRSIAKIKTIANIREQAVAAGYTGEDLDTVVHFMERNQQNLGRDMGLIWGVLTGQNAGFAALDQPAVPAEEQVQEQPAGSPTVYAVADAAEKAGLISQLQAEARSGHGAYEERFLEKVKLPSQPGTGRPLRVFEPDFLKNDVIVKETSNGKTVYWLAKAWDPLEEEDSPQREYLGYLLSRDVSNSAEIRLVKGTAAAKLSCFRERPGDYYLSRLIFQGNQARQPDQTVGQAFAGLLVQNIFLRKFDHGQNNWAYAAGIPASLDHDRIMTGLDATPEKGLQTLVYLMLDGLLFETMTQGREYGEALWRDIEYFQSGNSMTENLQRLRHMIAKYHLSEALIAAQGLDQETLRRSILRFKSLTNIRARAKAAGYRGAELAKITAFYQHNQDHLGRDMDFFWKILAGEEASFAQLDGLQGPAAPVRHTYSALLPEERSQVFNALIAEMQSGREAYMSRFSAGLRASGPLFEMKFEKRFQAIVSSLADLTPARVFHEALVRDEQGKLGIIKGLEQDGRELKNLPQQEQAAFLLSQGIANLAEIRKLTVQDHLQGWSLGGPAAEKYFSRLALGTDLAPAELAQPDQAKAFAANFVFDIWSRKWDQHLGNVCFPNGVAVNVNHDKSFTDSDSEKDYIDFVFTFLVNKVIKTAYNLSDRNEAQDLLEKDLRTIQNTDNMRLKMGVVKNLLDDFNLGLGLAAAEMLSENNLRASVLACKAVTPEQVRDSFATAGYHGQELEKKVAVALGLQARLGHDLDQIWNLMTGHMAGFSALDSQAPVRGSPDLAGTQISHEERNQPLREQFNRGRVFRVRSDGLIRIQHFWKTPGFKGWLQSAGHYAAHAPAWIFAGFKAAQLRKTVYARLERIRGPGGPLNRIVDGMPLAGLAEKLGLPQAAVMEKLLLIARDTDVFLVRDRFLLHENGPVAHARAGVAREGDTGIWLGEKLFDAPGVTDNAIARLLLEEAQHILAPQFNHDVILHNQALLLQLQEEARTLNENPGRQACLRDAGEPETVFAPAAISGLLTRSEVINRLNSGDEIIIRETLIWIWNNALHISKADAGGYARYLVTHRASLAPALRQQALDALHARFASQPVNTLWRSSPAGGKKNIYTYTGRLKLHYAFLLAYPAIRELLASGAVVNDIGIGGPVPSTVDLTGFLRSHGYQNRIVAADVVIPAKMLRSKSDPKMFAYYDGDGKLIAGYRNGMVLKDSDEKEIFPDHLSDLQSSGKFSDFELVDQPYHAYAREAGFELVKASHGAGVKAGIKFCMNTLYMDAGREAEILTGMAADLTEGGIIVAGNGTNLVVYQKQGDHLRPLSVHRVAGEECQTVFLDRAPLTVQQAEKIRENLEWLIRAQRAGSVAILERFGLQPSDFTNLSLNVESEAELADKGDSRKPGRVSPDLAAVAVPHAERNVELAKKIERAQVYRVTAAGKQGLEYYRGMDWPGRLLFKLIEWLHRAGIGGLDSQVAARLQRIRAPDGILAQMEIPVNELAKRLKLTPAETLDSLKAIVADVDVFVVRNRLTLHHNGPIAHARAGVAQAGDTGIWLGERLFTTPGISDADIARLLLEEAQHILAPQFGHNVVLHSENLFKKLTRMALMLYETPGNTECERDMGEGKSSEAASEGERPLKEVRPGKPILLNLTNPEAAKALIAQHRANPNTPLLAGPKLLIGPVTVNGVVLLKGADIYAPLAAKDRAGDQVYLMDLSVVNDHVLQAVMVLEDPAGQRLPQTCILQLDVDEAHAALFRKGDILKYQSRLAVPYVEEILIQNRNVVWKNFLEKLPDLRGLRFGLVKNGVMRVGGRTQQNEIRFSGEAAGDWDEGEIINYGAKDGKAFFQIRMTRGDRTKIRTFQTVWNDKDGVFNLVANEEIQYAGGVRLGNRTAWHLFSKGRDGEKEISQCRETAGTLASPMTEKSKVDLARELISAGFDPLVVELAIEANRRAQSPVKNETEESAIVPRWRTLEKSSVVEMRYTPGTAGETGRLISIDDPRGALILQGLLDPAKAANLLKSQPDYAWKPMHLKQDNYVGRTDDEGKMVLEDALRFFSGTGEAGWDVYLQEARAIDKKTIEIRLLCQKDQKSSEQVIRIDVLTGQRTNVTKTLAVSIPEKIDKNPGRTSLANIMEVEQAKAFIRKHWLKPETALMTGRKLYIGPVQPNTVVWLQGNKIGLPVLGEPGAKVFLMEVKVLNDHVIEATLRLEGKGSPQIRVLQVDTNEARTVDFRKDGWLKFRHDAAYAYIREIISQPKAVDWPAYIRGLPDLRGLRLGTIKSGELSPVVRDKQIKLRLSGEKSGDWEDGEIVEYGYKDGKAFFQIRMAQGDRVKIRTFHPVWDETDQVFNLEASEEIHYYSGVLLGKKAAFNLFSNGREGEKEIEQCRAVVGGLAAGLTDIRKKEWVQRLIGQGFDPLVIELAIQANRPEGRAVISHERDIRAYDLLSKQKMDLSKRVAVELRYAAVGPGEAGQLIAVDEPEAVKPFSSGFQRALLELTQPQRELVSELYGADRLDSEVFVQAFDHLAAFNRTPENILGLIVPAIRKNGRPFFKEDLTAKILKAGFDRWMENRWLWSFLQQLEKNGLALDGEAVADILVNQNDLDYLGRFFTLMRQCRIASPLAKTLLARQRPLGSLEAMIVNMKAAGWSAADLAVVFSSPLTYEEIRGQFYARFPGDLESKIKNMIRAREAKAAMDLITLFRERGMLLPEDEDKFRNQVGRWNTQSSPENFMVNLLSSLRQKGQLWFDREAVRSLKGNLSPSRVWEKRVWLTGLYAENGLGQNGKMSKRLLLQLLASPWDEAFVRSVKEHQAIRSFEEAETLLSLPSERLEEGKRLLDEMVLLEIVKPLRVQALKSGKTVGQITLFLDSIQSLPAFERNEVFHKFLENKIALADLALLAPETKDAEGWNRLLRIIREGLSEAQREAIRSQGRLLAAQRGRLPEVFRTGFAKDEDYLRVAHSLAGRTPARVFLVLEVFLDEELGSSGLASLKSDLQNAAEKDFSDWENLKASLPGILRAPELHPNEWTQIGQLWFSIHPAIRAQIRESIPATLLESIPLLREAGQFEEDEEESPDLAAMRISHEERNAFLKSNFYQGLVFRVRSGGLVRIQHFWREPGFRGLLAAVRQYAQHPFRWLTAPLQARFLRNNVVQRLNRIRGPGGALAAVAQTLPVAALAEKLGQSEQAVRAQLLALALRTDVLLVRGRLTLHAEGPMAHARTGSSRPGDQGIWLGEKLFATPGIVDTDIAQLLLEEAQHILAPKLKHDVILHSGELYAKLEKAALATEELSGTSECEYDATMGKDENEAPALAAQPAIDERVTRLRRELGPQAGEMGFWEHLLAEGYAPEVIESALRHDARNQAGAAIGQDALKYCPQAIQDLLLDLDPQIQGTIVALLQYHWLDAEAFAEAAGRLTSAERLPSAFMELLFENIRNSEGQPYFKKDEKAKIRERGAAAFFQHAWFWGDWRRALQEGRKINSNLASRVLAKGYTQEHLKKFLHIMQAQNQSASIAAASVIRDWPLEDLDEVLSKLRALGYPMLAIFRIFTNPLSPAVILETFNIPWRKIGGEEQLKTRISLAVHAQDRLALKNLTTYLNRHGLLMPEETIRLMEKYDVQMNASLALYDLLNVLGNAYGIQFKQYMFQRISLTLSDLWNKRERLTAILNSGALDQGPAAGMITEILASPLSLADLKTAFQGKDQWGSIGIFLEIHRDPGLARERMALDQEMVRQELPARNRGNILRWADTPGRIATLMLYLKRLENSDLMPMNKIILLRKAMNRKTGLAELAWLLPATGVETYAAIAAQARGLARDILTPAAWERIQQQLLQLEQHHARLPEAVPASAQPARDYIAARWQLRKLSPDQLFLLLDIFLADRLNPEALGALKKDIVLSMEEDRRQWQELQPAFRQSLVDYSSESLKISEAARAAQVRACRFVFSFDPEIRLQFRQAVQTAMWGRLERRFTREISRELAKYYLEKALTRYSIYSNPLAGKPAVGITALIEAYFYLVPRELRMVEKLGRPHVYSRKIDGGGVSEQDIRQIVRDQQRFGPVWRELGFLMHQASEKGKELSSDILDARLKEVFGAKRVNAFWDYQDRLRMASAETMELNNHGQSYDRQLGTWDPNMQALEDYDGNAPDDEEEGIVGAADGARPEAAGHQYTQLTPEQCRDIYQGLVEQGFLPKMPEFIRRFKQGIAASHPTRKVTFESDAEILEWLSNNLPDWKVIQAGIVRDENGVTWIVKPQGNNPLNRQRERLAFLLAQGRANLTEIRLLTDAECNSLSLKGSAEDYYLTRIVSADNTRNFADMAPLETDPAQAFAGIFVSNILMRKGDPTVLNIAFDRDVPVAVDHAYAFKYMDFPATPEGFTSYLAEEYFVKIILALIHPRNEHKDYYERLRAYYGAARDSEKRLEILRALMRDYGLGQGFVAAEMLEVSRIREAIARYKSLTGIREAVRDAGFKEGTPAFEATVHYVEANQATLGHDVDEIWTLLTGQAAGFAALDHVASVGAPKTTESPSNFAVATAGEKQSVIAKLQAAVQKGLGRYEQRFFQGLEETLHPQAKSQVDKLKPFQDKFLAYPDLVKETRGNQTIYWLVKQYNPVDKSNDPRREYLAYLVSRGIANVAEVRPATDPQLAHLPCFKGTPSEFYLTRLVFPGNLDEADLPARDPAQAFASILVNNILVRKADHHLDNWGYAGEVPVVWDQDQAFKAPETLTDQGRLAYIYMFLYMYLFDTVTFNRRYEKAVDDDLNLKGGPRWDWEGRLDRIREVMVKYGLDQALLRAEGLNEDRIRESILKFKAVTQVRELAQQAGYTGQDLDQVTAFMQLSQMRLGRDMDLVWKVLTGRDGGFTALDPERESPDMAATQLSHEERNAQLQENFYQGLVFRLQANGQVRLQRFWRESGLSGLLTAWVRYVQHPLTWLTAPLQERFLKNNIFLRLNRIRGPDRALERSAQSLDVAGLAGRFGRSETEIRTQLLAIARGVDVLLVRGRFTLHEDGPVAHARAGVARPGDQAIWLGEKLFTTPGVTDEDISRLLLEEAQHILAPQFDHDVIQHSWALLARLGNVAAGLGETPGEKLCARDAAPGQAIQRTALYQPALLGMQDFASREAPVQLRTEIQKLYQTYFAGQLLDGSTLDAFVQGMVQGSLSLGHLEQKFRWDSLTKQPSFRYTPEDIHLFSHMANLYTGLGSDQDCRKQTDGLLRVLFQRSRQARPGDTFRVVDMGSGPLPETTLQTYKALRQDDSRVEVQGVDRVRPFCVVKDPSSSVQAVFDQQGNLLSFLGLPSRMHPELTQDPDLLNRLQLARRQLLQTMLYAGKFYNKDPAYGVVNPWAGPEYHQPGFGLQQADALTVRFPQPVDVIRNVNLTYAFLPEDRARFMDNVTANLREGGIFIDAWDYQGFVTLDQIYQKKDGQLWALNLDEAQALGLTEPGKPTATIPESTITFLNDAAPKLLKVIRELLDYYGTDLNVALIGNLSSSDLRHMQPGYPLELAVTHPGTLPAEVRQRWEKEFGIRVTPMSKMEFDRRPKTLIDFPTVVAMHGVSLIHMLLYRFYNPLTESGQSTKVLIVPDQAQPSQRGLEALANRSLSSLESRVLKIVRGLFTPDLRLKPGLRWLPFQRLLGSALRFAVTAYLALVSMSSLGSQSGIQTARLRQLLAQDALDARQLDLSRFELRPLSQSRRSFWQARRGVLGGDIAFENGKGIIYVPDHLLAKNQAETTESFLFDLVVWANGRELQNLLAPEATAGSGFLFPLLALARIMPFKAELAWHRLWMYWQPQAYVQYLLAAMPADSRISQSLAQDGPLRALMLEWARSPRKAVQDRLLEALMAAAIPGESVSLDEVKALNQLIAAVPMLSQGRVAGRIEGEIYYLPDFSRGSQGRYQQRLLPLGLVSDPESPGQPRRRLLRNLGEAA
jgi:hypothetical protein